MTDDAFNIAIVAILKKRSKAQVSVKFDTDNMAGFQITQPVCYYFTYNLWLLSN